jgi:hypothetical protein
MKILIKPQLDYPVGSNCLVGKHDYIDQIWDIQLLNTFRELGYETHFIQKKAIDDISVTSTDNADLLLFYEITSFYQDQEYSLKLLNSFQGKKAIYIPTFVPNYQDIFSKFNYIFNADSPNNTAKWLDAYKMTNVLDIVWHCPHSSFLDYDTSNPYTDNKFKIVYFGIVNEVYLEILNRLATDGEQVYFGGVFRNKANEWIRKIPQNLINTFSTNLHMVANGDFECGTQYKWIHNANLGIVFYPVNYSAALSHKLVEYLTCGTRCLVESPCPNYFRVQELNAGKQFGFRNYNELYTLIQEEKKIVYNKQILRSSARALFDMKNVCKKIIESIR